MKPSLALFAHVNVLRKRIENSIFSVRVGRLSAYESRSHPFGLMAFGLLVSSTALAQQSPTHGTALFVIRTPQEIVAAADSRAVNVQPGFPDLPPICKIRPFGDAFVVANGVITDPPSGYAAYAIIEQAAKVQGDLPTRVRAFEDLIKSPLEKAVKRMKQEPAVYERYFTGPLTVTFFGIEGTELVYYKRKFPIRGEGVAIEPERCPGDCPGGGGTVYVQPRNTDFYTTLTQKFPNFERFDLSKVARRFVQMQIEADVPEVGPPIDVLRITKDRTCWEERKDDCKADIPKCSDIKPTPTKPRRGLAAPDKISPTIWMWIVAVLGVFALVYFLARRR